MNRDLDKWAADVIAKTFTAAKIADAADDFRRKFPRMRHPAIEAMFAGERDKRTDT